MPAGQGEFPINHRSIKTLTTQDNGLHHTLPTVGMGGGYNQPIRGESTSKNVLYRVLSNQRRRFILRTLYTSGQPIDVTELVGAIEANEADSISANKPKDVHERITTSLAHVHLPVLDDAGLLDWDRKAGVVRLSQTSIPIFSHLGENAFRRAIFGD